MRKPLSAGVTRHEASFFIRANPRQSVAKPLNPSGLFHSGVKLKFARGVASRHLHFVPVSVDR